MTTPKEKFNPRFKVGDILIYQRSNKKFDRDYILIITKVHINDEEYSYKFIGSKNKLKGGTAIEAGFVSYYLISKGNKLARLFYL